jgi:uncharacterized protein (TIGR03118 family)
MNRAAVLLASFALLATGQLFAQHYTRTNLTGDMTATAPDALNPPDSNLVNPWGLARSSTSFFWVSDNGTGFTTLYNGAGLAQSLVVKIPTPDGSGTSAPTGAVYNYTQAFELAKGRPASFIFVTEDGTVAGWNFNVDRNNAVLEAKLPGRAIYKGATLVQTPGGVFLYATNFKTGRVDVFDGGFQFVRSMKFSLGEGEGHFRDYVPFNIQNVGGNLVVTFAHRTPGSTDEDHGPGVGFAGIFDARGHLLTLLEHGAWFNAPWGVALAPGDFGPFSHRLLIGNFGDGSINAFNLVTGKHEGAMLNPDGTTLRIDGLWAIGFGGGAPNNGAANELFFTSGPNDESEGILGKLTATGSEQRGSTE